jgi:hypothetical protein
MKRLEDITTSLELSKKLKEAGFPQDSLFKWFKSFDNDLYKVYKKLPNPFWFEIYSAPTTDELLEQLPLWLGDYCLCINGKKCGYYFEGEELAVYECNKLCDSIASTFLEVEQKGLLKE